MRYSDITFRPIDMWPGELTTYRKRAPFDSPWGRTITLLERELSFLDAKNVVFQIAIDERHFRLDGKPRAQAKASHPGVILAFDSKYGPLKYAVDTFTVWDDNVRAIALAMEALRKVDRYGVTKRGEQYTGWRAIEQTSSDPADAVQTVEQARAVLDEYGLGDLRAAMFATHPDRGGDPDAFRMVMRAKEILGA
ncbi:MAG: heat shock protein DnaJ [Actinomycetia bacterium]|nr:heat shock protein DnaJ [Actinomycetes bacterium]